MCTVAWPDIRVGGVQNFIRCISSRYWTILHNALELHTPWTDCWRSFSEIRFLSLFHNTESQTTFNVSWWVLLKNWQRKYFQAYRYNKQPKTPRVIDLISMYRCQYKDAVLSSVTRHAVLETYNRCYWFTAEKMRKVWPIMIISGGSYFVFLHFSVYLKDSVPAKFIWIGTINVFIKIPLS